MHYRDKFPRKHKPQPIRSHAQPHLLDQFSAGSIGDSKKSAEALSKYHWDFYGELAIQRYKALPAIKEALLEASNKDFSIKKWQRVVKYKWSHAPLSARGSLIDPGGRFNIGEIDTTRFPAFSGLYIASDKETSMQEVLLGSSAATVTGWLDAHELALANPASITIVSVSGHIESVINLENEKCFKKFVEVIKDFEIDKEFFDRAKSLGLLPPNIIHTTEELIRSLMDKNWRQLPMFADVPATSQIFGQLALETGIGGIVYPSILTKKPCAVIFLDNFKNSGSFVQLDDSPPRDEIVRRVDAHNWKTLS